MDEAWHVIRVQPHRAHRAYTGMLDIPGVLPFFPKVRRMRQSGRGKYIPIDAAMFPGYSFARARKGAGELYRAICVTPGVIGLLQLTDAPATISDAEYTAILNAEMAEKGLKAALTYPFRPGDPVHVKGLAAKLVELDDDGRVTVLLSLFGRDNLVRVKVDEVSAA